MNKWLIGLVVCALGVYLYFNVYAKMNEVQDMSKQVAVVVASNGYQEREFQETRSALEKAGYNVTVVSDKVGLAVSHKDTQVEVVVDTAHVQPENYCAIYLIGGPGALDCLDNPTTYKMVQDFAAVGKLYGAICISPRILAKAGLLQGKKATGWDEDGYLTDIFNDGNVTYVHEPVVIDGDIVTAQGPAAAQAFGQAIVRVLQNHQ